MSKTVTFLSFALLFLILFGTMSNLVTYPDGPFTIALNYEGSNIQLTSDFNLHSNTKVVEYRSGSTYSKTSGTSSYSDIYVVTSSTNSRLDSWVVQGSTAPLKDLVVSIRNGNNQIIEAWKIYKAVPSGKLVQSDGSVKYTFKILSFERDLDIQAPVRLN